ncbi:MAG: glycosyltransferase [Candidatus Omnitrophica bacterium]|nr:glycosyltransferase [Candidatus Omnitrophota bacterium]
MEQKPFFSIIIPTYDRKDFLKIALGSVLKQTFSDYEAIVVDDGSTDNTKEIVKALKNKKLNYFYQKNKGPAAARNKGIKKANGKFICFLDSDDRFCREKLEITHQYIKQYPNYKVFHTEEIWYRNGRLLSEKKYHKKPAGHVFTQALKLCCISPSTTVIKRSVFSKIGLFDSNLPVCEDYDLFLRLTSKYPVFLIPKHLTIKEGGHSDQQSKKYPSIDTFRIYALEKILKNGKLSNTDYLATYRELKQKCTIYIKGAIKRNKLKEANEYRRLIAKYKKNL